MYHSTLVWIVLVTTTVVDAKLCVTGPIKLTLSPSCSLETIREAYSSLFNDELVRDASCTNSIEDDLKEFLNDNDLEQGALSLCASADIGDAVPFHEIAGMNGSFDSQFDKNFYDGGTYWNEEIQTNLETGDATNHLKADAAQVKRFFNGPAQYGTVEWPNQLSNFDLDTCDIHAAMCCWAQDRQANDNNGNCNTPYDTNCIDKDPADNTDLCLVNLDKAPQSNDIKSDNGILVHPGDNANGEGAVHCHGLAWSNDPNDPTARYKANNLFFISMYDHLHQRGYVRNIQGAPMCACVEQMPVVTRSDCTQTDVTETFEVTYNAGSTTNIKLTDIDVNFNACQGANNNNNDLSAYVARLTNEGHLTNSQKAAMKEILVEKGNCPRAQERNLARAGIIRGFDESDYQHILELDTIDTHEFVHGLCVTGASSVAVYSSDPNLYYTQYENFASQQKAWGDRDYVLEGVENTVCAGGIYLQPNRHKSILRYTDIVVGATPIDDSLTICGFSEEIKNSRRGGKWHLNLTPDKGFHQRLGADSGLQWVANENSKVNMSMFCRDLPIKPSSMPSLMPSPAPSVSFAPTLSHQPSPQLPSIVSMTLPATTTNQLVHGICVKGAQSASASSNRATYKTTMIENFTSGMKAWDDRNYIIEGVESTPCNDGLFLKPNRHKKIGRNTVIEIEIERASNDYATLCVFVEPPGKRDGGFTKSLPTDKGFTNYGTTFTGFKWGSPGTSISNKAWGMLCVVV